MSKQDACGHYNQQVAVSFYDLREREKEWDCAWCGDTAALGLEKSRRHELALCRDCCQVLAVLGEDLDIEGYARERDT